MQTNRMQFMTEADDFSFIFILIGLLCRSPICCFKQKSALAKSNNVSTDFLLLFFQGEFKSINP